MWRIVAIVLTVPFWGVACGGVVPVPKKLPASNGPCPKGTDFVYALDVIGPTPPGFEVMPGDKEALKTFVDQFRVGFGKMWRGYDAKVLVRRNKLNGTAVIVINAHEKTGGPDGFLAGAMAAEREKGVAGDPIDVAGQGGRMQRTQDGAFIAVAPAGTCSVVVLVADTEKRLRSGASALPPR
jgi:hypothetical protein